MNIEEFMRGYKLTWEQRDTSLFAALCAPDGQYHNTPFAVQRGHKELAEYWHRVTLQEDVHLSFEVLAATAAGGVAHWHVTYQDGPRWPAQGRVRRRAMREVPTLVAQHATRLISRPLVGA